MLGEGEARLWPLTGAAVTGLVAACGLGVILLHLPAAMSIPEDALVMLEVNE